MHKVVLYNIRGTTRAGRALLYVAVAFVYRQAGGEQFAIVAVASGLEGNGKEEKDEDKPTGNRRTKLRVLGRLCDIYRGYRVPFVGLDLLRTGPTYLRISYLELV